MVRDIISTAKLKLTVKPRFTKSVKSAEPIPRLFLGTEPMIDRKLGARNKPVPISSSTMWKLSTEYGVFLFVDEKR